MKRFLLLLVFGFAATFAFSQSDDDLFGGSDDDLFGDDSIVEVPDVSAKNDLSKGVIFDSGSIKVGGSLSAGLTTNTILYSPDEDDLGENIKNTKLSPESSSFLTVDARPTETLRIYTKFGLAYPFETKADTTYKIDMANQQPEFSTSITDWLKLKELFTDFSI